MGLGGFSKELCGKQAALAASASAAASPFNRSTWVKRYKKCNNCSGGAVTDQQLCAVVEGDQILDHKTTREQITLSFTAHLAFQGDKLLRRHTFTDISALSDYMQRLQI